MSFTQQVKKSGIIQRLEWQVETLQQVEIRQMVALACYEALTGGLPEPLLRGVNESFQGKTFKDRQDMYTQLVSTATAIWAEMEFERATADLDARAASEHTSGSSDAPVAEIQLLSSDTSGSLQE